jgi:hypothetical protein
VIDPQQIHEEMDHAYVTFHARTRNASRSDLHRTRPKSWGSDPYHQTQTSTGSVRVVVIRMPRPAHDLAGFVGFESTRIPRRN